MSRAFTKESESEWLGDVAPEINALEWFLTHEYGEPVFLLCTTQDAKTNREIHEMSNGNSYALG